MATPEEIELTKQLKEAQLELETALLRAEAASRKKGVTDKELLRNHKKIQRAQVTYNKTLYAYNAQVKKTNKATKEQTAVTQKATTELGVLSKMAGIASKGMGQLSNNADKFIAAGIGIFAVAKTFKKVGNHYDKYIKPMDEINLSLSKTFGEVRTAAHGFADQAGGGTAKASDDLRREILGLRFGLRETRDAAGEALTPLRFLQPGMAGVQEAAKRTAATTVVLAEKLDALTKPFGESSRSVLIFQEILSATDADVGVFADRSIAMGTTVEAQMAAAASATKKMGKAFNVNQKVLSKAVNTLRKDFQGFATFSEAQLAKVAATATKLGVSLEGITKLNMFDNFDQTAEKAAMLGQAFGINVDAFDLFAEQDPAERLRMLQEAATDAGVDVTQLGRVGLNYFSDLTGGMNPQDVLKAFSPGNIGRFEEGITSAAGAPAATMEQQQAQLVELNTRLTSNADKFFSNFSDLIPQAVSDFKTKTGAILDAALAGGDRFRRGEQLSGRAAGIAGQAGAALGSEGANAAMMNFFEDSLDFMETTFANTEEIVAQIPGVLNTTSLLLKEQEKLMGQLNLNSQGVLQLNKEQEKALQDLVAKQDAVTVQLSESAAKTLENQGQAFQKYLHTSLDKVLGYVDTGAGSNLQDKARRAIGPPPGKDIAMVRDAAVSPMTIVTPTGMIKPASNDEALIGQPGGMIAKTMEASREAMAAARTIVARIPMTTAGNQLTAAGTASNGDLTVNLDVSLPVNLGDPTVQGVLAKATLSGQVNPGGATLRQILERPATGARDFNTA